MKRKILLLVVAFVLLLGVFLAWKQVAPQSSGVKDGGAVGLAGLGNKQSLVLERRDISGRLIQRLEVPKWRKNDKDGSYECEHPAGVFYVKDTQRIYVRADEGTIYAEGVSNEIRRGVFRGNVKVFFDDYRPEKDTSLVKRPPLPRTSVNEVIDFLEEYPSGVVRLYVPDLDFNNEILRLQTDGAVTALSEPADLFGTGLLVTWSSSPQELVEVKIRHGQRADIYQSEKDGSMFGLPGSGQEQAASKPASGAATTTAASGPQALPEGDDSLLPMEPSPRASGPATASAPAVKRKSTKSKGRGKGVVLEKRKQNVYVVTFQGVERDIHVTSGAASLEGAQELKLRLEFEGSLRDRTSGGLRTGGKGATTASAPASRAATKPARKASTRPGNRGADGELRPVTIEWDGPLTLRPIHRDENPSDRRMQVVGKGKRMVLRDGDSSAVCSYFSYRSDNQEAWLKGTAQDPARLYLGDGQLVVCEQVRFNRKVGLANFMKPGYMARIRRTDTSKAQEAVDRSELMEATGLADADELKKLADRTHLPNEETADKQVVEDKISWGGTVLVTFKQMPRSSSRPAAGAAGALAAAEAKKDGGSLGRGREYVEMAHFMGDVRGVMGRWGDYLLCDDLTVTMGLSDGRRAVPVKTVAKALRPGGRVLGWQHGSRATAGEDPGARQRGTKIEAREITVFFRERPREKKGAAAEAKAVAAVGTGKSRDRLAEAKFDVGGRSEPARMIAEGDVVVTDTSRKDVVRAFAEKIEGDVLQRSAILYGKSDQRDGYARLTRGEKDDNVLAGAKLLVEDFDQKAIATGPGYIRFLSDKDFNGRKIANPRPVDIVWSDGMTYLPVGPEAPRPLPEEAKAVAKLKAERNKLVREAIFTGNVKMTTAEDTITAHKLTVELDPPAEKPTTKPASGPAPVLAATTAPADRGVLTVEDFGSRKLFLVTAEGNKEKGKRVELNTESVDDDGFLLRRMMAEADKLLYYAGSKAANTGRIEVPGPGLLFNEDYRFANQGGSSEGPSWSKFEWTKSMVLLQNAEAGGGVGGRTATLHGNVGMVHRSGRMVRLLPGLKVRNNPATLRDGRNSDLYCEDMVAEFDAATDSKDKKPKDPNAEPKATTRKAAGEGDLAGGPAIGRIATFSANGADADRAKGQPEVPVQLNDGFTTVVAKRLIYSRKDQIATIYGYLLGKERADAEFTGQTGDGQMRTYKSPWMTIRFDPTGKTVVGVTTESGSGLQ